MTTGSKFLMADIPARARPEPRLKLLLEREPAYVTFFHNLVDILLMRQVPRVSITSKPAVFWRDVFVSSRVGWRSMLESLVWHMTLVALIVATSLFLPRWERRDILRANQSWQQSSVVYYPAARSFSAPSGKSAKATAQAAQSGQGRLPVLRVSPGHRPGTPDAPDVKMAAGGKLNLPSSDPILPRMSMAATGNARLTVPSDLRAAVGPPPQLHQARSGRLGAFDVAVAAPSPDSSGVSSRRAFGALTVSNVVAPAPVVQSSMRTMGNSDITIGASEVVAPSPHLPMHEQIAASGFSDGNWHGGGGNAVVPPAPTMGGSGMRGGGISGSGHGVSLGTGNANVAMPAPSARGIGGTMAGGRTGTRTGYGLQAVPPAPSVGGLGTGLGTGTGGGTQIAALGGTGSGIVPPAPSLEGLGGGVGNGDGGTGSGGGGTGSGSGIAGIGGVGRGGFGGNSLQAVGPAPSGMGLGGSGLGRGGSASMLRQGLGVAPKATRAAVEPSRTAMVRSAVPKEIPKPEIPRGPSVQLPLRLIALAMSLPGSSYFSNYEVYVAERRPKNGAAELIKLVYIFLPYQRRLSEYTLDNTRIYRLKVRRDPTCDESLMQITWPEANKENAAKQDPNAEKNKLPCYRTTADDYRKALEHPQ